MPPSKHTSGEQEAISSELQIQGLSETDSQRLAGIILAKADALEQRGIKEADAGEVRVLIDGLFRLEGLKSSKNGFRQKIILFTQQRINSLLSPRGV
jgi:hypothetical protein